MAAAALAAGQLGKNSVGSRQLKSKAVTTGKIANNAVNGSKVAKDSLTGADINLSALGTVPSASQRDLTPATPNTVGGHSACLSGWHHPDPRHLLRLGLKPGRSTRSRSRRRLRRQGRLPADARWSSTRPEAS